MTFSGRSRGQTSAVTTGSRPRTRTRWIAWTAWSVSIVLAAIGGALVLLTFDVRLPDNWGFRGYAVLMTPVVATPGLLLALRVPRNAIGWLLLVAGLATGFSAGAQEYATYAVVVHPGSLPGAVAIAWIVSWSFVFFAAPLLLIIPQLFPDGRPLGPRWRPLLGASAIFAAGVLDAFAFRPGPLENASFMQNPLPAPAAWEGFRAAAVLPLEVVSGALIVLSGASLAVRFRRSSGMQRQQLKWVALSASLIATAMLAVLATTPATATNTSKPAQVIMILAFGTLPVAIAVAILRYRLYDIDLIINRTIVYGALSAVIGTSYFVLVVMLQAILRPITGGSEIAVAASTLAVIAVVQPLRRRIQAAVDRRFYRSRYDAARALDTFATRLRDEVDLETVRGDIVAVVADTVQPRHASLWLRRQRL